MPPEGETFRLLFVCTGNICRSPVAEIMARHILIGALGGREASRFPISSAGVGAVVGEMMHPQTRDELSPWGLDGLVAGEFRARQLRSAMVRRADLVLGANVRHRSAIVEREPAGLRTTFALREFAALVDAVDERMLPADDPVKRATELVDQARMLRGIVPMDPEDLRVPDPIGRPQSAHREAVELVTDAVHRIVRRFVPAR
ncbi:arsenate reductase/protein-tyrosine-phosphatase family protein [Pseudonocardia pini]|uniref:arsenate reductase/protein-tyrosine-phosphatase family protein n=1 Tax=Pseudonocardia pini TaxID=2758030 RepID=UPI0015F0D3A2|nr:low molecular weight phosphatase family protein [Pseudonocardia pini]